MNKTHVLCTTVYCAQNMPFISKQEDEKFDLVWPVAKANALPFQLPKNFHPPYTIVFTSHNAIEIFFQYEQEPSRQSFLQQASSIFCVGESSAQHAKKLFNREVKAPLSLNGLKALYESFWDSLENNIFIFTSLKGKTRSIIEGLPKSKNSFVFEIYELLPFEPSQEMMADFIEKLTKDCKEVIFECRSGFTLKTTADFLCQSFHCSVDSLPSFISFRPWGASAQAKCQELGVRCHIEENL